MADAITKSMGQTPCPTKERRGPGQAPVTAHPMPNMAPPSQYLVPDPMILSGMVISFPAVSEG